MTSTKIHVAAQASRIVWDAEVVNDDALIQKVALALVTVEGSDATDPGRGTTLRNDVLSGRAFDLRSLQHAINFSNLKARRDVNRRGPIVRELIGEPDLSGGRPQVFTEIRTPTTTLTTTI